MFIMLIKYKDHRMNMFTNSSKERRIYGRLYSSSSIRELRVVIRERERGLKVMTVYSTCTLLQIGPTKSLYGSWLLYTSISIVYLWHMQWLYLFLLGFLACALQLTLRIAVVLLLLIAILITISAITVTMFALSGFLLFRLTASRMCSICEINIWQIGRGINVWLYMYVCVQLEEDFCIDDDEDTTSSTGTGTLSGIIS